MHCPVRLAALEAGKYVFCQAPHVHEPAGSWADGRGGLQACQPVTMICPPPHDMAGDYVMRRLLQKENFCGKVPQVRLTSPSGGLLDENAPLHWRRDERLSGRNVLGLGIYMEVLRRWLGCHSKVVADFDTYITERKGPETGQNHTIVIPDAVRTLAHYESGAGAAYHLSGLRGNATDDTLEIYRQRGHHHLQLREGPDHGCKTRREPA